MPSGSCLCGDVSFDVEGELKAPDACHCSQCRKQSGHYWASTNVPEERLTVRGEDQVTWYKASEDVRRGFCGRCGSFLFWDPLDRPVVAVAMGAFEAPTGTELDVHIHMSSKGDYYEIADGVPQRSGD